MTPARKKTPLLQPKPFDPSLILNGVLGTLLTATLFFSGELNERSGAFAVLAVLWILTASVRSLLPLFQQEKFPLRLDSFDVGGYVFFGLVVLSIIWNLLPGHGGAPRPSLNMLAVWLGLAAAWFCLRQMLNTPQLRSAALRLVLVVVVAEAATGLYQQFVEHPKILRQFEADPISVLTQADPSIKPNTPEWNRLVFRLKTAGPTGTFPLTNTLGGLLGTGFVLMLGYLVFQCVSGKRKPKDLAVVSLTFFVLLCFVLTRCRSGLVAVAIGLFLLGTMLFQHLDRSWRRWLLFGSGVVVVLLVVAMSLPGKSLLAGARRSLDFRLEYWQASFGIIRDYPILGCGSGNFKSTYMKYKLPGSSEEIADPHNFAVELTAVAGIPAMILFLILAGHAGRGFFRRNLQDNGEGSFAHPGFPVDSAKILYWSGLGGGILAGFVSLNAEAQITLVSLFFLFVTVPLVAWAFPLERAVPPSLLAITLIVLLVHLLAAGGISASNTALVVWLLFALLEKYRPKEPEYRLKGKIFFVFPVLFIASLLVVNQFCLRPVVSALSYTVRLDETSNVSQRVALLQKAAAVDPWAADIQEMLATEAFRTWFEFPKDEQWKTVVLGAQEQALFLSPRSAGLRYVFAERLMMMYEKTGDKALQDRSLELFAAAVERYPNHAKFRAPFAVALWKSERRDEAVGQRNIALHLDDLMLHPDQKLPENLRRELLAMIKQ